MAMKWEEVKKLAGRYDKHNFLGEYLKWGERFRRALENTPSINLSYETLYVVGMVGSGIVGDILNNCLGMDRDIRVVKYTRLPKYIGEDDLVLAVSFSGNTIETLSSVEYALSRKVNVVGITTGGKLAILGKEKGFTVIKIEEALAPRAALPQLIATALKVVLEEDDVKNLAEIATSLSQEAAKYGLDRENNRAYKLAYLIWGRLPIFYADEGYSSILHRAKSSLNENAKVNAYYQGFPEGYHNEVEIFEEIIDPVALPIIFKDKEDDLEPLIRHLDDLDAEYLIIDLVGKNKIEKILRAIVLTDIASIYLAYIMKRDPFEINVINKLKRMRG